MTEPSSRFAATVVGRPEVAALVLEATPDMGATLVRYTAGRETAGDIWYGSADEAQSCAARDYGAALGAWHPIPDAEADPAAFALRADPDSSVGSE